MRYLLNLPLLGAAYAIGRFAYVACLQQPQGGWAHLNMGIDALLTVVALWVLLGLALAGCATIGALDWLPVSGKVARFFAVAACYAALVLLFIVPFVLAVDDIGTSRELRGSPDIAAWAARFAAIAMPLVLLVCLFWLVNAPPALRDLPAMRQAMLGALAATMVIAACVAVGSYAETILNAIRPERAAKREAANRQARAEQTETRLRGSFRALSPADPLKKWAGYTTDAAPMDLRHEALQMIAARPGLAAELAALLAGDDVYWAEWALWLIRCAPFTPSAALDAPVRRALAVVADDLRQSTAQAVADARDRYVDVRYRYRLALVVNVALRMAESAGVDLRDALHVMLRTVVEIHPRSDAAQYYPQEIADAERRIAAILAAAI
ncbi:MAG: hypothetical protein HY246_19640 [Proteobacteria bacterium]|nr:hypothetical protein [Pseudomonadota bacterium]